MTWKVKPFLVCLGERAAAVAVLALVVQGCVVPWAYPPPPENQWEVVGLQVIGQVSAFAFRETVYSRESWAGKQLLRMVADAPLRAQTDNPVLRADTRVKETGWFEFSPLTGPGVGLVSDRSGQITSARPDKIVLTLNESGANPYLRPIRTSSIVQPAEAGTGLCWSAPRTVNADGTPLLVRVPDTMKCGALDQSVNDAQVAWAFEFRLVARMTDSAAAYLADHFVRPRASAAANHACVRAGQGDYAAARESLAAARECLRHTRKLVGNAVRYPRLEDSLKLAERMVKGPSSVGKAGVVQELVEAGQSLVAVQAAYDAQLHNLQHNSNIAEPMQKQRQLEVYEKTRLQPAVARYEAARQKFLAIAPAAELADLARIYGFSSLLK